MSREDYLSAISTACIMVISHMAGIALAVLFVGSGMPRENADNPGTPVLYIIVILVFTAIILLFIKRKRENIIRYIIMGAIAYTMFFIFLILSTIAFSLVVSDMMVVQILGLIVGIVIAGALTYLLVVHPEWYVVDGVGIIMAAGVTAVLGVVFGILPAMILLIGLAIYDAISVYKTKHMITLADTVTDQRLPVLLVIPKKASYSFRKQKRLKMQIENGEEREAMFVGLGDIIIPGMLVVASFIAPLFIANDIDVGKLFLVPIGTMIGILAAFSVLMYFVSKGRPQAGLPLLNTGAILGYVISYILVFQDLSLGIVRPW